jgi:endonuclease/exonuclease/phosphatase family metal-dependent hydrolase
MKIIFWNIGYARGIDGSFSSYVRNVKRFFSQDRLSQKKVLQEVARLISSEKPDVFAYAEIMTGSKRNGGFNQHTFLLSLIDREHHATAAVTKYGNTIFSSLPFHKGNCNGVISFSPASIKNHLLQHSRKKLVQETILEHVTIFSVHLPLISRDRKKQFLNFQES